MIQRRSILTVPNLAIALLAVVSLPAAAQKGTDGGELAEQLAKAETLMEQEELAAAAEAFRLADELAAGQSVDALLGLTLAEYRGKAYENAVAAARRVLELSNEPDQRIVAYNTLGLSLSVPRNATADQLQEAEDAFRKVLELSQGREKMVRFSLASVLRMQGRNAAALDEARELLGAEPPTSMADRTRILICALRRSLPGGAPPPRTASAEPRAEDVRQMAEDVEKPEKIYSPQPNYSEAARKKKIQGVVIVQAIIDREGCVVNTEVLKGLSEGMSEQAVAAIRNWVFRPAMFQDLPVDVYYKLTVNFRLQRKRS